MPLTPYALCTFNDVTSFLTGQDPIPAAQQTLVESLINRLSQRAAMRTNRFFGQSVYVNELHSGTGRQIFTLNQAPVWSVQQISMLTAPGTYGLVITPLEYWLLDTQYGATTAGQSGTGQDIGGSLTGMVWRERGWWAGLLETPGLVTNAPHPFAMRQNISATYLAGWALPRDFGAFTVTGASGGALALGTYYYRVSQTVSVSVTLNGTVYTTVAEPLISPELSVTLTSGQGTVTVAWTPQPQFPAPGPGSSSFVGVSGTVSYGYRVYRGVAPGAESLYYAVSGVGAASFSDTGAAGTAGSPPVDLPDDIRGGLVRLVAGHYRLRTKQGVASETFSESGASMNTRYDWGMADAWEPIDAYRHIHGVEGI